MELDFSEWLSPAHARAHTYTRTRTISFFLSLTSCPSICQSVFPSISLFLSTATVAVLITALTFVRPQGQSCFLPLSLVLLVHRSSDEANAFARDVFDKRNYPNVRTTVIQWRVASTFLRKIAMSTYNKSIFYEISSFDLFFFSFFFFLLDNISHYYR